MVIQQYQDPTVNRWLKVGFWYQEHKEIINKFIIGALIGINVIFWGATFYQITKYIFSSKTEQALYDGLVVNNTPVFQIHEAQSPKDVVISNIITVPSAGDKSSTVQNAKIIDLIVIAKNPNLKWVMSIDYYFKLGLKKTLKRSAQILPEQKMPLIALGVDSKYLNEGVEVETQIKWQRIKDFNNLKRAINAQNNIIVSKTEILSKNRISDIKISVENKGAYAFKSADVLVLLSRPGRDTSAVGIYTAQDIFSEKNLEMNMRWLHYLSGNLQAEIYPLLDFLDNSIYILPEGNLDFRL